MSKLEVDPDVARQILSRAAAAGQPVEEYLKRIADMASGHEEDFTETDAQALPPDSAHHTDADGDVTGGTRRLDQPDLKFRSLASKWRDETGHLSSYTDRIIHPAYQEIIGMGEIAVP